MAATAVVRRTARERDARKCVGACPASAAAIAAYVRTVTLLQFYHLAHFRACSVTLWENGASLAHCQTDSTHSQLFIGFLQHVGVF